MHKQNDEQRSASVNFEDRVCASIVVLDSELYNKQEHFGVHKLASCQLCCIILS